MFVIFQFATFRTGMLNNYLVLVLLEFTTRPRPKRFLFFVYNFLGAGLEITEI